MACITTPFATYSLSTTLMIGTLTSSLSVRTLAEHLRIFRQLTTWLTGAFAFFGPSQFEQMYTEVTQPAADFLLHFAGEGTSTNHA